MDSPHDRETQSEGEMTLARSETGTDVPAASSSSSSSSSSSPARLYTSDDEMRVYPETRHDQEATSTTPVTEEEKKLAALYAVLAAPGRRFIDGDEYSRDRARVVHSASLRRLRNKAQLFPPNESDVFRTRLTHSMEVSQIAQSLAKKAKREVGLDLSLELIEMAGLAHDIGHPPFGHLGEFALNEWMRDAGGFEGNAQNLRVLAVLEKKRKPHGLNLTYRSLAAVLKKDAEIGGDVKKGYYSSEKQLVDKIRTHVLGKDAKPGDLRTIECSIMDAADDIAYATYDLEDSLKGGFINPMDMLTCDDELADRVAAKINKDEEAKKIQPYDATSVKWVLRAIAIAGLSLVGVEQRQSGSESLASTESLILPNDIHSKVFSAEEAYTKAMALAANSRWRTALTSLLIKSFMNGVSFVANQDRPCLSKVEWESTVLEMVMVLKHFTFYFVIKTPQIQAWESNGKHIVSEICKLLWADKDGDKLPPDWRIEYRERMKGVQEARVKLESAVEKANSAKPQMEKNEDAKPAGGEEQKQQGTEEAPAQTDTAKDKADSPKKEEPEVVDINALEQELQLKEAAAKRVICDFVAGMTDNYAVEFYGRLTSLRPITIFKKP